jgi:hypothetical protein
MRLHCIANESKGVGGGQHKLTHEGVYITDFLHAYCAIEHFKCFVAWNVQQIPHSLCICCETFLDFPVFTPSGSFDICCISMCCDEIT